MASGVLLMAPLYPSKTSSFAKSACSIATMMSLKPSNHWNGRRDSARPFLVAKAPGNCALPIAIWVKARAAATGCFIFNDEESELILFLLLLYAKSDRADVGQQELRELINEAREANKPDAETSGENNEEQAPPD